MPRNEPQRLETLRRYQILDSLPEASYDDITLMASRICGTPISLVSLVDAERQWFKSRVGLDAEQTPRDVAFCAHAILEPGEILEVPDASADPRFAGNPLVEGDPHIRFYAGAPLVTPDEMPLGTLCVIDRTPRELSPEQRQALTALARQVMSQLELRAHVSLLQRQKDRLEESQAELERSNRELDDFAQVVSHDLREPLRGIHGYSSFLLRDHADALDAEGLRRLEIVKSLADQMNELIESLLHFSRVGRTQLAWGETFLQEVVDQVLRSLQCSIEERNVTVELPRPLPSAYCDRARIGEVFRNLIENAIKYAADRPDRRIEIGFRERASSSPVFYVRDNGIGIKEKQLERIFGMFKRLHGRGEFGGGHGVGLAIVKKIVERHGGWIRVESQQGEGSTFSFSLAADAD